MITPDIPFNKVFTISSFDVDAKKQASLQSICRYMQEIAALHAIELKLGFHDMMKENRAWVLAQVLIRMDRYPRFQEKISINTWSNGPDGRYAMRDFEITDADGNSLGKASSTWFVIDIHEKNICRLDDYFRDYKYENIKYALGRRPDRVKPIKVADSELAVICKYSDLDINAHVNNVRYVDHILDMFPSEFRMSYDVHEIEMNFLKKAKEGVELTNMIRHQEENREYLHGWFNKNTTKPSFTARTVWH